MPTNPPRAPETARLLILDDDVAIGQLLVFVAQKAGYQARLCGDPAVFFDTVQQWAPTHLAIDLAMPGMHGLDVMRQLAASGCTAWVIVSSGAGVADIDAALHQAQTLGLRTAGALIKPFSLASVRALLARTARGQGSETP